MSDTDTDTKMDRKDIAEQGASEMLKKGRDGAYRELNVASMGDFVTATLEGSKLPEMVVLSGYQLDLSEYLQIFGLVKAIKHYASGNPDMDPDQLGLYVFRKIFEKGLGQFN